MELCIADDRFNLPERLSRFRLFREKDIRRICKHLYLKVVIPEGVGILWDTWRSFFMPEVDYASVESLHPLYELPRVPMVLRNGIWAEMHELSNVPRREWDQHLRMMALVPTRWGYCTDEEVRERIEAVCQGLED